VLSDVHLGQGGSADLFGEDDALVAMLEQHAADPSVRRIVLLGDTVELVDEQPSRRRGSDGSDAAVERMSAVWRAHPDVLQGLRATLRAGKFVTVVRGNHDAELARPAVQAALAQTLGAPDSHLEVVVPWLWHVPGLLLAEHGHQHHDINAFDHILTPFTDAAHDHVQEPFGATLGRLHHGGRSPALLAATATVAAGQEALRMVSPHRTRSRMLYRRDVLPSYALDIALPPATVDAIDRLTEVQPHRVVRRLVRQLLPPESHGGYLPQAAGQVAHLLQDHAPRFLVFGHTHAADARPLTEGTTYLNTGTWCSRGPRPGDSSLADVTSTWVEIDLVDEPGHACAKVLHWSKAGSAELLAEVDPSGTVHRPGLPRSLTTPPAGCAAQARALD